MASRVDGQVTCVSRAVVGAQVLAAILLLAGCAPGPAEAPSAGAEGADGAAASGTDARRHPDVVDVELIPEGGGEYRIAVTLSSPYDAAERYADGWRVLDEDGQLLAEHDLAHHHADEQPFTRVRGPFSIPDHVLQITVEGRDLVHGYGGATMTVEVPR